MFDDRSYVISGDLFAGICELMFDGPEKTNDAYWRLLDRYPPKRIKLEPLPFQVATG